MNIGIIGNGVVGSATAHAFVNPETDVRCFDVAPGRSTHHLAEVLDCDLVFICLPTPQKPHSLECDLSALEAFFATAPKDRRYVLRSTIPIGTTRKLRDKYQLSGIVHSPEFLTARTALHDAENPTRLVIGYVTRPEDEDNCLAMVRNVYYKSWPKVPLFIMTAEESEATKLYQNAFSAVKIAFFNEIDRVSEQLRLRQHVIMRALLAGGWINPMHTQVPGTDGSYGFGGSCLPKDLANLTHTMHELKLFDAWNCSSVCEAALVRNEDDRKR